MNSQLVDFEGNFDSQDPALQPTATDFAMLSRFFQALKQGLSIEEARRMILEEGTGDLPSTKLAD